MAGIYFFADGDQMVFLGVSFLPLSISFEVFYKVFYPCGMQQLH